MIRLHFFSTQGVTPTLIRLCSASRFNHVAIEIDGVVWEADRRGHRRVKLCDWGVTSDAIVALPTVAPEVERDAVRMLDRMLPDRYGYAGVLATLVGLPYCSERRESHCSAYVCWGLLIAELPIPGLPDVVTPGDLARVWGVEARCVSLRQRLRRAFLRRD